MLPHRFAGLAQPLSPGIIHCAAGSPTGRRRMRGRKVRILPDNIPAELKALRQWVNWKETHRNGRLSKVPVQPNGAQAKVNDPSTWSSFSAVMEAYECGRFVGIGYVLTAEAPFCFIDLDACYHSRDGLAAWAEEIVNALNSYTELSPSGTGLHIFVRGKSPFSSGKMCSLPEYGAEGGKDAAIEIYDTGKYFCVTGRLLREGNQ
jgi:putative DNA primase/helicase